MPQPQRAGRGRPVQGLALGGLSLAKVRRVRSRGRSEEARSSWSLVGSQAGSVARLPCGEKPKPCCIIDGHPRPDQPQDYQWLPPVPFSWSCPWALDNLFRRIVWEGPPGHEDPDFSTVCPLLGLGGIIYEMGDSARPALKGPWGHGWVSSIKPSAQGLATEAVSGACCCYQTCSCDGHPSAVWP